MVLYFIDKKSTALLFISMERALYTAIYPSYNAAERPTRFIEFIKQVTESYIQYVYLYELEHCK